MPLRTSFLFPHMSQVQKHAPALEPDRKAPHAALVGAGRLAIREADHPVVQRTSHVVAVHDAFAEWPALVRAAIVEGEHLVGGGAEHRDLAALGAHHAATSRWNV